jgi:hypothetical protein
MEGGDDPLKVAAAARAMEMEAAEKANAHALGAANARMQSSIIWSVGGVAFVMVLALIFLSCLVHDIRPGQPSHCNFPSPTLDWICLRRPVRTPLVFALLESNTPGRDFFSVGEHGLRFCAAVRLPRRNMLALLGPWEL